MSESHHSRVFKKKLTARRQELLEVLATGHAADWGAYKQLIGEVYGLDNAIKLSDEADLEISGG